jgi:hypothetical protein
MTATDSTLAVERHMTRSWHVRGMEEVSVVVQPSHDRLDRFVDIARFDSLPGPISFDKERRLPSRERLDLNPAEATIIHVDIPEVVIVGGIGDLQAVDRHTGELLRKPTKDLVHWRILG